MRILSLEKESKALEEQVLRLRDIGGSLSDQEARNCLFNQLETLRGQERAIKLKVHLFKKCVQLCFLF